VLAAFPASVRVAATLQEKPVEVFDQQMVVEVGANAEGRGRMLIAANVEGAGFVQRAEVAFEHRAPIARAAGGAAAEYRLARACGDHREVAWFVTAYEEELGGGGAETDVVDDNALDRRAQNQTFGGVSGGHFQSA
jgi:hypothetical protein